MQKIFDEKALFSQRLRVALEAASYGTFKYQTLRGNLTYVMFQGLSHPKQSING